MAQRTIKKLRPACDTGPAAEEGGEAMTLCVVCVRAREHCTQQVGGRLVCPNQDARCCAMRRRGVPTTGGALFCSRLFATRGGQGVVLPARSRKHDDIRGLYIKGVVKRGFGKGGGSHTTGVKLLAWNRQNRLCRAQRQRDYQNAKKPLRARAPPPRRCRPPRPRARRPRGGARRRRSSAPAPPPRARPAASAARRSRPCRPPRPWT